MDRKELIVTGKLKELNLSVFNKKLDASSKNSYTDVLSDDEECLIVEQILKGGTGFLYFLQKYQKHYPLCNKAIELLLNNVSDKGIQQLLLQNFKLYGYNEIQATTVCKLSAKVDGAFLYAFCTSGRVFYADLYTRLSLLCSEEYKKFSKEHNLPEQGNWGELYKQATENYHKMH